MLKGCPYSAQIAQRMHWPLHGQRPSSPPIHWPLCLKRPPHQRPLLPQAAPTMAAVHTMYLLWATDCYAGVMSCAMVVDRCAKCVFLPLAGTPPHSYRLLPLLVAAIVLAAGKPWGAMRHLRIFVGLCCCSHLLPQPLLDCLPSDLQLVHIDVV